ncbi:MAG: PhzF family phenazine biosynthesis protein [Acidiferrobacterales bacterium]
MRYRYYTVDVFTETRFGGNQLAVLPEAGGLSAEHMQSIAREFNFSETTFVLPPESPANDAKVRIFTPDRELQFAGHPNLGTAHVLSTIGGLPRHGEAERTLRFEELAGIVAVRVRSEEGVPVYCELTAPQTLELGPEMNGDTDVDELAHALSLRPADILTDSHFPRRASVGLPFLCVEIRDRDALSRSQVRVDTWTGYAERAECNAIHLYTRDTGTDEFDLRGRMYVTMGGVREDPATGSANCALAGLLASLATESNGTLSYRIAQGVEMGRPSALFASVEKRGGAVVEVRIGGASVSVADGSIDVG